MIILMGVNETDLFSQAEQVVQICEQSHCSDSLVAQTEQQQADILRLRSELYPTYKDRMADTLDITVPPASIGAILEKIDEIARKYNTTIPAYGHLADGNLHGHILKEVAERGAMKDIKREIYIETLKLGGVITGEHGIGRVRIMTWT